MSLSIPLRVGADGGTGGTLPGARLAVPPVLGPGLTSTGTALHRRAAEQLRAAAAAVAVTHPKQALKLVKDAREKPDEVILDDNGDPLKKLLTAISDVQDDRSKAPKPDELELTVARAVGADSVHVAAATATIDKENPDDPVSTSGRHWVVSLDVNLLERAVRAAVRARALRHVPDQSTRLSRLEAETKKLREDVDELKEHHPPAEDGP